ncbi:putative Ig domain-containing protein [Leptospira alstonii]|uniref:putative Ig domain-containing protein n=1 Tax=Leptospira alstonii TaxID=28452 RepID=UPI0007749E6D|nr:putative Ig domain-containing protein [Leptospira alstonii]
MKKIMLTLLLLTLVFASCEDDKKDEGSLTGNTITDLLLLQGLSNNCPSGVTMNVPSSVNVQVGTAINPLGIQFSAGSTTHETLIKNASCGFSDFTATNLPAGLTFNSTTGAVSGAPTTAAAASTVTFTAKMKVNGSTVTLTKSASVTVLAAGLLTCNTVGNALGCNNPALPFSCPSSNSCYSTYSNCKAATDCGY